MPGHADVEQHDVGRELARRLERLAAVAGLADHRDVRHRRRACGAAARAPAARRRRSARGCASVRSASSWAGGILRGPPALSPRSRLAGGPAPAGSAASPCRPRRRRPTSTEARPGKASSSRWRMLSSAMRLPLRTARAVAEHRVARSRCTTSSPSVRPVDRHRAALGQRLDAVADRVLEQRLQQQARHDRAAAAGRATFQRTCSRSPRRSCSMRW